MCSSRRRPYSAAPESPCRRRSRARRRAESCARLQPRRAPKTTADCQATAAHRSTARCRRRHRCRHTPLPPPPIAKNEAHRDRRRLRESGPGRSLEGDVLSRVKRPSLLACACRCLHRPRAGARRQRRCRTLAPPPARRTWRARAPQRRITPSAATRTSRRRRARRELGRNRDCAYVIVGGFDGERRRSLCVARERLGGSAASCAAHVAGSSTSAQDHTKRSYSHEPPTPRAPRIRPQS